MKSRILLFFSAALLALLLWSRPTTVPPGPAPPGRLPEPTVETAPAGAGKTTSGEVELDGEVAAAGAETADAAAPAPAEGLPIGVEIVDGETGDGVAGAGLAWVRGEEVVSFTARGSRHELAAGPAKAGEELDLTLSLAPPSGWLLAEPGNVVFRTPVSAFAQRLEVTLPLFREAQLYVEVFEADGSPVAGAEVREVRFFDRKRVFRAETTDEDGRTRIGGIPNLRGEFVEVVAAKEGRQAVSESFRLPWPVREVTARVVLPRPWGGPIGRGGHRSLRAEGGGSATGRGAAEFPGGRGRLEITVLRRDGSPAAGAAVCVDAIAVEPRWQGRRWELRADGAGRIVLSALPDSSVSVSVREPGYLGPKRTWFDVADGATTRGTIREEPGAASVVTVVDAEGSPLGGVRIEVAERLEVPYVWLADGVQRLAVVTDAEGRAVLPNLPAGGIRLTATFGSRRAYGDVRGGEPLTLVLGGR